MRILPAAWCLLVGMVGCVAIIPYDTGGSRVDGMVTMSAQRISFTSRIDWASSEYVVLEKCRAWGYTGFQAFSGVSDRCISNSSTGCDLWQTDRNYQCTQ